MAKWYVAAKKADFNGIGQRFSISPVLARVIRNRDIEGDEAIEKYLHGTIRDLYDPALLKGSREAVLLLKDKIKGQMPVRVIGDYDADGICSSYILKRGLEACGAVVDTMIPHRMKDGYGLNEHLVDEAYADGIDTILTCDNGIAAYAQIEQAKKYGMTVIITDHHEIPYEEEPLAEPDPETGETSRRRYKIPPADVVIDPKQPGDTYPFQEICGAVVAFKLMQLLFAEFGFDGISTDLTSGKRSLLDELLEFAAFATICDVMPLREENRILVRHGLELMKQTQNVGLHALMEVNQILPWQDGKLGAFHIGFVLGPCLNASGRLDSAQRAMELLDSKTREAAVAQAAFLKQLNDSRKEMTEEYVKIAVEMIESGPLKDDRVLVVFLPDCHESIAGIIAGRIRERYYRPTFVLTRGEEGVKGSARSIEGYHIYEEMTKCSSFFTKYGGHKMAAGLSMPEENLEQFRKEINEKSGITPEDLNEKIAIDMQLPFECVNEKFIEELAVLEPFGKGNARPVFAERQVQVESARILGKNKNVLKLQVKDLHGTRMDAMYFGDVNTFVEYVREKFGDIACECLLRGHGHGIVMAFTYYPDINEYQGVRTPQIVIQNYK